MSAGKPHSPLSKSRIESCRRSYKEFCKIEKKLMKLKKKLNFGEFMKSIPDEELTKIFTVHMGKMAVLDEIVGDKKVLKKFIEETQMENYENDQTYMFYSLAIWVFQGDLKMKDLSKIETRVWSAADPLSEKKPKQIRHFSKSRFLSLMRTALWIVAIKKYAAWVSSEGRIRNLRRPKASIILSV